MVLGNFRSFHVLVLTLRVLGLPYSFNPVITVPLSSLRLVSSSSSVWRFLLLVSQMLRPSFLADSWAFINHGVPGDLIQINVDWASNAHKAYLEFSV